MITKKMVKDLEWDQEVETVKDKEAKVANLEVMIVFQCSDLTNNANITSSARLSAA